MKYFFQAEFKAHIDITDKDFYFILECCKNHYSYDVQALVSVGGVLYGAFNRREFAKKHPNTDANIVELTFRQMDTILKGLEMCHTDQANIIGRYIHSILTKLNEVVPALNKKLQEEI